MDGSGGLDEMTCRDAFREWIVARDQGEVANDAPDEHLSCAASSVDVLFVGKDNSTVSVAAEAIFTDLCEKHALHCFSSHSAGTCVGIEGELPDRTFIDALRSKRGLDISRKMACTVDKTDLESYSLVVCMDEATRSELLYMVADEEGRYNDAEEKRFVVLSSYCTDPKLQAMQFKSGRYARDTMNMLLSALVDSCDGLLMWLMENPPMLQT